jgi:hypothetical protein
MPDCTGGLRPHAKRWHGEYSINPAVLIRMPRPVTSRHKTADH